MKKKVLSVVSCIAAAAMLLTGCVGGSSSES